MNNRQTTAETPEQIIEHISRLMAEAEAMLAGPVSGRNQMTGKLADLKMRIAGARERAGDMYSNARARVGDLYTNACERVGDVYSNARQGVVNGARHTDQTIRENPYYSMAVALGVGVLIGALVRRSRE